jgi:DNA-binding cell septation regulator SpoVG
MPYVPAPSVLNGCPAARKQFPARFSCLQSFADVVTDEGIIIKGFTIAEGAKGLFADVPSEQD